MTASLLNSGTDYTVPGEPCLATLNRVNDREYILSIVSRNNGDHAFKWSPATNHFRKDAEALITGIVRLMGGEKTPPKYSTSGELSMPLQRTITLPESSDEREREKAESQLKNDFLSAAHIAFGLLPTLPHRTNHLKNGATEQGSSRA